MNEMLELVESIKKTEENLFDAKEALQNKKDSLYLHADWKGMKEKGITNQTQRDAHVRSCTERQREKVNELEILLEYHKNTFRAMLHESKRYESIVINTNESVAEEIRGV